LFLLINMSLYLIYHRHFLGPGSKSQVRDLTQMKGYWRRELDCLPSGG